MGTIADSKVVVTRIQNVALGTVSVIGGKEIAGNLQLNRLGSACGNIHLVVTHQLNGGLFNKVFLVIIGVRRLRIQLHRSLTIHAAGVAYRNRSRKGICIRIVAQVIQCILIGGVRKAIAEREADFLCIVPSVGGRLGARGRICIALSQNSILITGFIVTVADVNALVIADKAVTGGTGRFARIVIGVQTEVFSTGGRQRVCRKGCLRMAGGIDLTGHHTNGTGHTIKTGVAHPQDGINVIFIQPVHFHCKHRVQQYDDLFELAGVLDFLENGFFVVIQLQHTLALVIDHGEVVALRSKAGERDKGNIAIGRKGIGHTAGEQRRIILANTGNASCLRCRSICIGVQYRLVDVEARTLQGINGGLLVFLVGRGTACGAAEYRVNAAATKGGHVALRFREGQCVIAVIQQNAAFLLFLLTEFIGGLNISSVACIRQRTVCREFRSAVRSIGAFNTKCVVYFTFLLKGNRGSCQNKVCQQNR